MKTGSYRSVIMVLCFGTLCSSLSWAQLKTQVAAPFDYGYFGPVNTSTNYNNGAKFSGTGIMAGWHVQYPDYDIDTVYPRLYVSIVSSIDVAAGSRSMNDYARSNYHLDPNGAFFAYEFEFGFQAFYRITEKLNAGGQIFYTSNYDDTRKPLITNGGGDDDHLMYGLHVSFDRFSLEYDTKPGFDLFNAYQKNERADFIRALYVYSRKSKHSIGIALNHFYTVNGYDQDLSSTNIRLVWIAAIY